MTKTKNFPIPRTVMLDEHTAAMLTQLATSAATSASHVIRAAIRNAHAMTIDARPTCANGSQCHCPHTHNLAPRHS